MWQQAPESSLSKQLNKLKKAKSASFYFHFPYCQKLCYYCGCHRKITKSEDKYREYVSLLLKELDLYSNSLKSLDLIEDLHFGGGTPSLIPTDCLEQIISKLINLTNKKIIEEMSIEVDPRTCDAHKIEELIGVGFHRFSFGIQDFDPMVQQAIGRVQTFDQVEALVHQLRRHKISTYNFDLILGLPRQSIASVESTLDLSLKLKPSRLALYSYAHMPDHLPNQKLIKEEELPNTQEKLEIIEFAREYLLANGYKEIGMDHFALETDELFLARNDGYLHRNFMGYTTAKAYPLIGIGLSSISDFGDFYYQNSKSLNEYQEYIEKNQLPIVKTHQLDEKQIKSKELILDIFCKLKIEEQKVKNLFGGSDVLDHLLSENLIHDTDEDKTFYKIKASDIPHIRYIAKKLDPLLTDKEEKRFSSGV